MSEETTMSPAETTEAPVADVAPVEAAPPVEAPITEPETVEAVVVDPVPIEAAPTPKVTAKGLVSRYLSAHGAWREVTASSAGEPPRTFWEFTPCECAICADALALVGEPNYDA